MTNELSQEEVKKAIKVIEDVYKASILPELETPNEFQETQALVVKDISQYRQHFDQHYNLMTSIGPGHSIPLYDYDVITNADAYMTGPVCLFDKKTHAAESIRFKSLQELKEYLNDKKYILYYAYASFKSVVFDMSTFTTTTLEKPEIEYYFRGVILNK